MTRDLFDRLRRSGELGLIPYLVAGFPHLHASMRLLEVAAGNGADLIELGVPFGDPVADGPTIQRASQRALDRGACLREILSAVGEVRVDVPISLMSYLNPLLALGREPLLDAMARAGLSGLIVPDLPLEEAGAWLEAARDRGIELTLLVAPTSTDERVRRIAECCDGFVYYVSVTGTTGAREALAEDLFRSLERLRRLTTKPIAVGFGLSTPDQIRRLRGRADAAVVGSRIVEAIEGGEDLAELVRQLKAATRSENHADRHEAGSDRARDRSGL